MAHSNIIRDYLFIAITSVVLSLCILLPMHLIWGYKTMEGSDVFLYSIFSMAVFSKFNHMNKSMVLATIMASSLIAIIPIYDWRTNLLIIATEIPFRWFGICVGLLLFKSNIYWKALFLGVLYILGIWFTEEGYRYYVALLFPDAPIIL